MIPDQKPVLRVQRDAWTRLLYLQLGAFAFFLYAFSPALGFLRDDLHISAATAGLHSTTYAVGVTLGGVTAPWYIVRAGGSRSAMWLGLIGLCSAVSVFCAVPALAVTLPAAAVCGVFGSWLGIAVPSALSRSHGPEVGPAAITEANAVAALVGIAAPLAVGGAAAVGIGWRTAMLAVIPLSAVLYLASARIREPELAQEYPGTARFEEIVFEAAMAEAPRTVPEPRASDAVLESADRPSGTSALNVDELSIGAVDRVSAPELATLEPAALDPAIPEGGWRTLSRGFWINQIAGVCVVGIEFSLTLWCATLLRDRGHISPGAAATGVTAIVAGLAAGRFAGGWLALRYSIDRLLFVAFGCNALGFAFFWLTAAPIAMFVGLAVAGLGMSLQYPLVSSRGIKLSGGRAELAGAVNMLGGGIAIGIAPFLLGYMSDRVGIHLAYLLVPALIAIAVVALVVSRPPRVPRGSVAALASETMAA